MRLSDRQVSILIRLNEEKCVTSENLSFLFKVSTRTIKEDIKQLKMYVVKIGAEILGYPSKGYVLKIINENLFEIFLKETASERFSLLYEVPSERKDRQDYIMVKLLTVDYHISVDDLAEELFIDRTTLLNDIKRIKSILSKYDLQIENKVEGLKIIGMEVNFRLCLSDRVFHLDTTNPRTRQYEIKNNIDKEEYKILSNILYQVLHKNNLKLSYDSFSNFVYHIMIAKNRWTFYNYVSASPFLYDSVKDTVFLTAGIELISLIEEEYSKVLPFDESIYFALHFKTKRILGKGDETSGKETSNLVFGFIERIKRKFSIDLGDDKELIESLNHHFPVMISRLELKFNVRNPKAFEYCRQYLYAYLMAKEGSIYIEEITGLKLSRDEKSYLILYINLALRKKSSKRQIKVLFLGSGSRSEDALKYYEFLEISSLEEKYVSFKTYSSQKGEQLRNYDLIVSNIPGYRSEEEPYIDIGTYYTKGQVLNCLEGFGEESEVIIEECRIEVVACESREQFMQFCNVRKLRNLSEVGSNVGISYSFQSSEKTSLEVYILNRPILFQTQFVRIIINVSLNKNSYWSNAQLMKELSFMICDGYFLTELISTPSKETMLKRLNSYPK